jgi:uncharacterized protein YbjT (DUF2867 family)
MTTILVIGATGHVGRPVAERLRVDGRRVRLLVRDVNRARRLLGNGFDLVRGSIDEPGAVTAAMSGIDGVHVSVTGGTVAEMMATEAIGMKVVAAEAARAGIGLVSYVSGNLVREEYGPKLPEHRAKIIAEDALMASGVPFVIFRPTYFMENLTRHIQGGRAITIGHPQPLHMVAAADFGSMVSRAFDTPAAHHQELVVHGPEPLTIQQALACYRDLVRPELRCTTVPVPVMAAANRLFLRGSLTGPIQLMRLLERIGERGDPAPCRRLLGTATTTLRQWCASVATAERADVKERAA